MSRLSATVALVALVFAPVPSSAGEVLTNADVLALVKAGLSPAVLKAKISSSSTAFGVTTADLIHLSREGVPQDVLEAMIAASSRTQASTSAPPTSRDTPPSDDSSADAWEEGWSWDDLEWKTGFVKPGLGIGCLKLNKEGLHWRHNRRFPCALYANDDEKDGFDLEWNQITRVCMNHGAAFTSVRFFDRSGQKFKFQLFSGTFGGELWGRRYVGEFILSLVKVKVPSVIVQSNCR